jgi:hypothetical protein
MQAFASNIAQRMAVEMEKNAKCKSGPSDPPII